MSSTWCDHAYRPGGVPAKRVRMTSGEMAIIARTYLTNPGDWEQVVMNMRNNSETQVDLRTCPKVQGAADGKIKNEM